MWYTGMTWYTQGDWQLYLLNFAKEINTEMKL